VSDSPAVGSATNDYAAVILDPRDQHDRDVLDGLRRDERIAVLDHYRQERGQLAGLRPVPDDAVLDEPQRWAYYPWRRSWALADTGHCGSTATAT
jgi:hypothetical protein